jgi:outer membrane receptor protein involved in Fe transport
VRILYGPDSDAWERFNGAPCYMLDKDVKEDGTLYRANLTYEFDDHHLIYGTYSEATVPVACSAAAPCRTTRPTT